VELTLDDDKLEDETLLVDELALTVDDFDDERVEVDNVVDDMLELDEEATAAHWAVVGLSNVLDE